MNTDQDIRRLVVGLISLVAVTGLSSANERTSSASLLGDERALQAFVERITTNRMQEGHVPGAVVTMRFIQVAPMLFQSVKGDEQVSFRTSTDGERIYLIDYNVRGDGAFKRISALDRAPVPEGHQPFR